MSARLPLALTLALLLATSASAATFGELSANRGGPSPGAFPEAYAPPMAGYPSGAYGQPMAGYPSGAYAQPMSCPPMCAPASAPGFGGPEGVDPDSWTSGPSYWDEPTPQTAPRLYLPMQGQSDLPHGQLRLWSFGQMNSMTDPFNPYGLSTPDMFVPWSTPLSGWANAQTWNWWRERSGALPRNW